MKNVETLRTVFRNLQPTSMKIYPTILTGKENSSGLANITIRLSKDETYRYIKTKFYVRPKHFKNGTVIRSAPDADLINIELRRIVDSYYENLKNIDVDEMSISEIAEILRGGVAKRKSDFLSFFSDVVERKRIHNDRTAEIYLATLRKIELHDPRKRIPFRDITAGWLTNFESWLKLSGNRKNSISIHLRNIRAIFNVAIDDEIIPVSVYPFSRFKIRDENTKKRSISAEQVQAMINYQPRTKIAAIARDLWMLSFCLIGANNSDIYNLTEKSILKGRTMYDRNKTGRNYSIKIEPETQMYFDRLKGRFGLLLCSERYLFPENMTTSIDRALKPIGEAIGEPRLSMMYARHTWASIAKNKVRVSVDDIAAAMGHSQKGTTQIYIDYSLKMIDQLNRKVLDTVFINASLDEFMII